MRTQLPFALWCALVFLSCSEFPAAPTPARTLQVVPDRQWAGQAVQLLAEGVGRESDLEVLLGGEPVEATAISDDALLVSLPNPSLTRAVSVSVRQRGRTLGVGNVEVVGQPWRAPLIECPNCSFAKLEADLDGYYHGAGLGGGRFLATFETGDKSVTGIATLHEKAPAVTRSPQLTAATLPGLVSPGIMAGTPYWILDNSGADLAAIPDIWDLRPPGGLVGSLACVDGGIPGVYAIAGLTSGDCLVLSYTGANGSLSRNGVDPIPGYESIPWKWTAGCAAFRASPSGDRVTLRSLAGFQFCEIFPSDDPPPAWPVFDADGGLAFSSTRYATWPRGVSFTKDSRVFWTVGDAGGWSLDEWDAATGELLSEHPLPNVTSCWDVLVDPFGDRVFVSCFVEGLVWQPSLLVFDSSSGSVEATVHAIQTNGGAFAPYELVHGGPSGRVHLVAPRDGTNAPVDRVVWVSTFDTK